MNLPGFDKKAMRNAFSGMWNKQFLIFLFFLGLSASFWLFMALNETYEEEFEVELQLSHVPDNVVITTPLPEYINVTMRDKGVTLLGYRYGMVLRPINIEFEETVGSDGHVALLAGDILKRISRQALSSTEIIAAKPDTLDYYYNHGEHKRVPVGLQGEFSADELYYISHAVVDLDSVDVYAPKAVLDTITRAFLSPVYLLGLTDTVSYTENFVAQEGVKYEPASANVSIFVDRLVEKTVQVPVVGINFPEGKVLRCFPSKVSVTFQVGMARYRDVDASDFALTVDYQTLRHSVLPICKPFLSVQPYEASYVKLVPTEVEYVIEDVLP